MSTELFKQHDMAVKLFEEKRFDEAEQLFRLCLSNPEQLTPLSVAMVMNRLANCIRHRTKDTNDPAAKEFFKKALAINEEVFGSVMFGFSVEDIFRIKDREVVDRVRFTAITGVVQKGTVRAGQVITIPKTLGTDGKEMNVTVDRLDWYKGQGPAYASEGHQPALFFEGILPWHPAQASFIYTK